jgi:ABC-2 type transport system ATP-binding protein
MDIETETTKTTSGSAIARRFRALPLVVPVLTLVGSGLASVSFSSAPAAASTSAGSSTSCQAPSNWRMTKATAVSGTPTDYDLTSFDGTKIRIHWFPNPTANGAVRPTVLMGPGWGSSGDTDTSQAGIQGALTIQALWQGGFNVLTWDPRGFGKSGGAAEVDSPNDEGRDVSTMINWVAQQHGVEVDRPGVPRIGMVGESYGGGIQFATAEQDCRIDAIAPTIAWNSLGTSLDKSQTPKAGWSEILASVSSSATLDPTIARADNEMKTTGRIDAKATAFFISRGPAQFLSKVKIPTLILQGTVDDLFTLDEGIANYETLKKEGTTVSMAWFCGGHGVCLTNPGTAIGVGPLSLAWMQHFVAKDAAVKVLKGFEFVDQNGTSYAAKSYPLPQGAPIVATGSGSLQLTALGGSGPPTVPPNAQAANAVDVVALGVTPAPASNALNISVPITRDAELVGAPTLKLTYSGTAAAGERLSRVFAQLVDPATGIVVNNQITPIPLTLDGRTHSLVIPMETIGYTGASGKPLELQLTPTTVAYVTPRLGGSIHFSRVVVSLPTVSGLTVLQQG